MGVELSGMQTIFNIGPHVGYCLSQRSEEVGVLLRSPAPVFFLKIALKNIDRLPDPSSGSLQPECLVSYVFNHENSPLCPWTLPKQLALTLPAYLGNGPSEAWA